MKIINAAETHRFKAIELEGEASELEAEATNLQDDASKLETDARKLLLISTPISKEANSKEKKAENRLMWNISSLGNPTKQKNLHREVNAEFKEVHKMRNEAKRISNKRHNLLDKANNLRIKADRLLEKAVRFRDRARVHRIEAGNDEIATDIQEIEEEQHETNQGVDVFGQPSNVKIENSQISKKHVPYFLKGQEKLVELLEYFEKNEILTSEWHKRNITQEDDKKINKELTWLNKEIQKYPSGYLIEWRIKQQALKEYGKALGYLKKTSHLLQRRAELWIIKKEYKKALADLNGAKRNKEIAEKIKIIQTTSKVEKKDTKKLKQKEIQRNTQENDKKSTQKNNIRQRKKKTIMS